ncbi:MAG: AAA family ATPase [Bacteroidetes bacterium]|nr:AAA family ATPase [Bacteroidota bacterium]
MLIIGITGTLGAGKGTIVDFLVKEKNFAHYSVRAYLLDEIRKKGLPENRDSMVMVANELRKSNSPSFITDSLFEKARKENHNAIIESIRTPGEITSLRNKSNFYLLAVDADPKKRFDRIVLRNSETDKIDFDTFIANEQREMITNDPNKQNLRKCIEMADFVIENNDSVKVLYRKIAEILHQIEQNKD